MILMEVSEKAFEKEVLASKIPVLVEFWGSWCPPCKVMEPIIERLEKAFSGKVKICKVNTDRNPSLRRKYEIRGLPTFIIFVQGKDVERHVAAKSEQELKGILDKFL
jgi:thioredoxin 1